MLFFLFKRELHKQLLDPKASSVYRHASSNHFLGCHATAVNAVLPVPVKLKRRVTVEVLPATSALIT
jgi:hypothetical protein